MSKKIKKLSFRELRWTLDPDKLSFRTTEEIEPLRETIGQKRGVDAFRFGMDVEKKGYNIFVTGQPNTGRLATVQNLLKKFSTRQKIPDDLCYVNNFKDPDSPVLLRFPPGQGSAFKNDMHEFVDAMKREIQGLFESEEYQRRKREISEEHERRMREFFSKVEDKVKETNLALVQLQMGTMHKPDVVPVIDGELVSMTDLKEKVDKGEFPEDKFNEIKANRDEIREDINKIVRQARHQHKELLQKLEEMDKGMVLSLAEELIEPLREKYQGDKIRKYFDEMVEDLGSDLERLKYAAGMGGQQMPLPMMGPPPEVLLRPYEVNLLVDNSELKRPPIVVESYPTYRNLFGSIERVMDRSGGYSTDFTKIRAGSFIKANGGYLVVNLLDAIVEPGVWQTLKRSLKTEEIKIETYDPYFFFSATGLRPEPIKMEVKVAVIADPYLYDMLRYYDPDAEKIFKVRADFSTMMDRTDAAVMQVARFIRSETEAHGLKPLTAGAVAAVVEESVRMAGWKEKLSTYFPLLSDLLAEADHFSRANGNGYVTAGDVNQAIEAKIARSNRIEEIIQEMIDRGTILVDVTGAKVGQVNGLAVYTTGDYSFGKPSRITASISMGRDGLINIEREAKLSGPTHNKGVLILAGCLRRKFAQDKPLTLSASIAFEQSYSGVDGDSASSTEYYALISSLSGKPLRQDIAVTGSLNQNGEVQAIGGVNQKIEGFFRCCKALGLTGEQGVMIPVANIKDLMLRGEVTKAVEDGRFHVWAVSTVEQGLKLLTGTSAGERRKDGSYPRGTVYALANAKLKALAEGLRDFGKPPGKEE